MNDQHALSSMSPGAISVPLIVDDVKTDVFQMTRLLYFYIDGDESSNPWILDLMGSRIPFRMVSLSGVILGPADGQGIFSSAPQISELFSLIERTGNGEFSVDCSDLFLPNWLLEKNAPLVRNHVFRVTLPLFSSALGYRLGQTSSGEFEGAIESGVIYFSESDTSAFRQWAEIELEESRRYFRHDLAVERRPQ
jgi:hypothetical protein